MKTVQKLSPGNIIQARQFGCMLIVLSPTPTGLYQCYGMGIGYVNVSPQDVISLSPLSLGEIKLHGVKVLN
jgi:hypothetical protein